jgi:hypothetical protein
MATGDSRISQKSCISYRAFSGLKAIPTGCCIQAFATSIQKAERLEPRATIQVANRCIFLETRSQPKNMTEKKLAIRNRPKIASVARKTPNMSPAIQAKFDQLDPS